MPSVYVPKSTRMPPGIGEDLNEPLLYNPYQQSLQDARRLRFCLNCKTVGSMDANSRFKCGKCGRRHTSNLTAPRVFTRLGLLAGRGSGKTLIGAHAVREEMLVPNGITWVMGPTYKVLHDSTFPTLVRRIPPSWVKRWDPEHTEITLHNGHLVAFRSLEDPERARGPHGVTCGWFDEAAQSPKRAYDVFTPTLTKAAGIVLATTTPMGYDWTYDEIEKRARLYKEPGYWWGSFWTEENPLFKTNPVMMRTIEQERRIKTPEWFAQEYHAERHNATGLVYSKTKIDEQVLRDANAVRALIPEWPNWHQIFARYQIIIGLDSGADHPFGAVLIVATEHGLVVVGEHLKRMQAVSQQLGIICTQFNLTPGFTNIRWAANKNEANLRLEWALKGVSVLPVEAKHDMGIQRVQSWLHSGRLFFAYTAPKTIEQMCAYRYAENTSIDGQKKPEKVFKFEDELPDALRYALMSWPELPRAADPITKRDLRSLDPQTRSEIERMSVWERRKDGGRDLVPTDEGYPARDFYASDDDEEKYSVATSIWS